MDATTTPPPQKSTHQYQPLFSSSSRFISCVTVARLAIATIVATFIMYRPNGEMIIGNPENFEANNNNNTETTSIAFIGNSILYFNDCPRLMKSLNPNIIQNSCLRGGSSIIKIINDGNGMSEKFATPNARSSKDEDDSFDIGAPNVASLLSERDWDVVVINDYTQAPARNDTRNETIRALTDVYAPLLLRPHPPNNNKTTTTTNNSAANMTTPRVVFLMTAAYRHPVKKSSDLGSVADFTRRLREGYASYARAMDVALNLPNGTTRVAPFGTAVFFVYQNDRSFWERLYYVDDFHPSPHGSYLEACVLHWTVFGRGPPKVRTAREVEALWERARVMQPKGKEALPLPTVDECGYLWEVARDVCRQEALAGKL